MEFVDDVGCYLSLSLSLSLSDILIIKVKPQGRDQGRVTTLPPGEKLLMRPVLSLAWSWSDLIFLFEMSELQYLVLIAPPPELLEKNLSELD